MPTKDRVRYIVSGQGPYCVEEKGGGILYDLVDSRLEAKAIRRLLNRGPGPDWDKIEGMVASTMKQIQDAR